MFARAGPTLHEHLVDALSDLAQMGEAKVAQGITGEHLVVTGKLLGSLTTRIKSEGQVLSVGVLSNDGVVAATQEGGREPGELPSMRAIRTWVVARIGSFHLFTTKTGRARRFKLLDKHGRIRTTAVARKETSDAAARMVDRIAFAVAKVIAKEGTKGHRMFAAAMAAMEQVAPARFEQAVDLSIADMAAA
jgi:hypothetical protein